MNPTHEKPFTLSPGKSPEEIANEVHRKMAPEIRSAARALPISAAEKFFYYALIDLSFLHCYGGSGRGKIFISIKDLSRLVNHNKDSIAAWRDQLVSERLIWVRESWPKSEWRICAMCPAPMTAHGGSESDFIRGKAASFDDGEQSGILPLGLPDGGKPDFGPNSGPSSDTKRKDSASPSEGFRYSIRRIPPDSPTESVGVAGFTGETGGILRTDSPKDSASQGDSVGQTGGNLPHVSPKVSATNSEGFRSNKETPLGELEKGVKGGGATPPVLIDAGMEKWLGRLDKMFPRELDKVKSDLRKALPNLLTKTSKAQCRWKLNQVEERLTGPQPEDVSEPKTPLPKPKMAVPGPGMVKIHSEESEAAFRKARKEAGL
jgi:hypothetical protein